MGLFGQSTPFDADIEKATNETNTNENWSLILDVCDKVQSQPRNAKDCLKAIMKRMGHTDPHVVLQAITLLDACANNCGKSFHLEIASREFENEFRRLLTKAQPKISLKMRQVLKNWAENDFKNDPELNLIPTLYNKLRQEGLDFSNLNEKPTKSANKAVVSKDPNVVNSQQEEDDIAKAIELSLKEAKNSPKNTGSVSGAGGAASGAGGASAYPSLYPSFVGSGSVGSITSTGAGSNTSATSQPEPRKVRALYDFEAAEENELTFFAGEIIHVVDDTDPNWWKGFNQRGDGLFPSNFVTADLSADPERLDINQQQKSKKTVQFEDDAKELQQKTEAAAAAAANQRIEIDEAKVDRLLHLLHEANPEDPSQDSDEMLRLEQEVNQMGPLIDAELERVDRKHAQLTQLSTDLVDAMNLYYSLMRDDRAAMMAGANVGSGYMAGGMSGGMPSMTGAMPGLGYQGAPNAQMLYGAAGYGGGPSVGGAVFPPPQHAQMPQNYGMSSLPYANVGGPQLPASTAAMTTHSTVMPPAVATTAGGAAGAYAVNPQQQMPIPMQFQNGHVNSPPQMNGGMSSLPPHMSSPLAHAQQQQQQQQQQQTPQQQHQTNYQMLQQQPPQQQALPQTTAATTSTPMPPQNGPAAMLANNPQQQLQQSPAAHPQFMSLQNQQQAYMQLQQQLPPPHQQQQTQQQFAPMPNGPQTFMSLPPGDLPQGFLQHQQATAAAAPPMNNHNSNQHNVDQQMHHLQQHMAAMSMGINQPVTQNFLVQNETKNNIPIYQQR